MSTIFLSENGPMSSSDNLIAGLMNSARVTFSRHARTRREMLSRTKICCIILGAIFLATATSLLGDLYDVDANSRINGCQCTDFVYGTRADIPLRMGHARDWLASAREHRIPYDQVPQTGDIAVLLNGVYGFSAEFGHVAIVTDVNEDHDRFSIAGWDGLKNNCQTEEYHDLVVTADISFIHQSSFSPDLNPYPGSIPHRVTPANRFWIR
jgi:hypothetical protein